MKMPRWRPWRIPKLARSRAGERLRTVVRFCAGKLGEVYGNRMGWRDAPPAARSTKAPAVKPVPIAASSAAQPLDPTPTLVDAIGEAIERAGPGFDQLWMAQAVYDELLALLSVDRIDEIDGLVVAVRENWRWGYVVVAGSPTHD